MVSSKEGELAEALTHQKPQYLVGYVLKLLSCQFTLKSQSENVHAALIMTMTETITPYLYGLQVQVLLVQVHVSQHCGVSLRINY